MRHRIHKSYKDIRDERLFIIEILFQSPWQSLYVPSPALFRLHKRRHFPEDVAQWAFNLHMIRTLIRGSFFAARYQSIAEKKRLSIQSRFIFKRKLSVLWLAENPVTRKHSKNRWTILSKIFLAIPTKEASITFRNNRISSLNRNGPRAISVERRNDNSGASP